MAIIVAPSDFKDAFLKAVSPHNTYLARLFRGPRKAYTNYILHHALPGVATHLNLQYFRWNYFWIDCIYYEQLSTKHLPPRSKPNDMYVKHINVVVEHENVIGGTAVEMNRLQIYNAPLKVLITYSGDDQQRQQFLNMYSELVTEADIFNDFPTLRRQFVIFGDPAISAMGWSFYEYTSRIFIPI